MVVEGGFSLPETLGLSCTDWEQHGESMYNLEGKIGGDSYLSQRGEQYARKLPELVRQSTGVRSLPPPPPGFLFPFPFFSSPPLPAD